MNVLVACEFSGVVRNQFWAWGHQAWSCDLLPSEDNSSYHLEGDVLQYLGLGWDLMIAHPPCTYLTRAAAPLWTTPRWKENEGAALQFVLALANAPIPRIAIENPVGRLNKWWRYPDQSVQPWQYGHACTKQTCLWLKGLPLLQPTCVVKPTRSFVADMSNHRDRWKTRSRTFLGIGYAMATQWGKLI